MQHLPRTALDEEGHFVYQVTHEAGLEVRSQPSVGDSYRTDMSFEDGDLVSVDYIRRSRDKNSTNGPFLRLSDCSGWLFQTKEGTNMMKILTIETGIWTFYVDNYPYGQSLRSHPTDRMDFCIPGSHYKPMQKVYCDRRVKHPTNGVSFYRVQGTEGWLFDKRPEEDNRSMLLDESEILEGLFAFRASTSMSIRSEPSVGESSRTQRDLDEGDVVVVDIIHESPNSEGDGPFLRLVDGSGWLFEKKHGISVMQQLPIEKGSWKLRVINSVGIALRRQPIDEGDWMSDIFYKPGEEVICDRRIVVSGKEVAMLPPPMTVFYRVKGTGGWVFDKRGFQTMTEVISVWNTPPINETADKDRAPWTPDFVRGIASTVDGLKEVVFNPTSSMISFRSSVGIRINVYYVTHTVGTTLKAPSKEKVQLFRRDCTATDLLEIFHNPHALVYYLRNQFQHDQDDRMVDTKTGWDVLVEEEEIIRQKLLDCMEEQQRIRRKCERLLASIRSFDMRRESDAMEMLQKTKRREAEEAVVANEEVGRELRREVENQAFQPEEDFEAQIDFYESAAYESFG